MIPVRWQCHGAWQAAEWIDFSIEIQRRRLRLNSSQLEELRIAKNFLLRLNFKKNQEREERSPWPECSSLKLRHKRCSFAIALVSANWILFYQVYYSWTSQSGKLTRKHLHLHTGGPVRWHGRSAKLVCCELILIRKNSKGACL
jgi:hypothetical protein